MNNFKVEYLDINPGDLANADVDFYEVDFYPVIYVNDSKNGELGAVALDGRIRSFPLTALYSYNASQLSEQEFFDRFPMLRAYFESPAKQAA